LRLNTEYLEQRPNDQAAQLKQIDLLSSLSLDAELATAIAEYYERDGYDLLVLQGSMFRLSLVQDSDYARAFVKTALERVGDSAFVKYQAHRALLWAGDIDGASRLARLVQTSDLPEQSRQMAALRQACAENRLADAKRIYDRLQSSNPDDTSIMWLSHSLMGQQEKAFNTLIRLDDPDNLAPLGNFLTYAHFDPRLYPNLMALLEAQGVTPRKPLEIPYRCKT